jgi:hypothetical protein
MRIHENDNLRNREGIPKRHHYRISAGDWELIDCLIAGLRHYVTHFGISRIPNEIVKQPRRFVTAKSFRDDSRNVLKARMLS